MRHGKTTRIDICTAGGRHAYLVPADDAGEYRMFVEPDDMISMLYSMGCLTDDQRDAAETLFLHWYTSGLGKPPCSQIERSSSQGQFGLDAISIKQEISWMLVRCWLKHIEISDHRREVIGVVIDNRKPAALRWLQLGLDSLFNAIHRYPHIKAGAEL